VIGLSAVRRLDAVSGPSVEENADGTYDRFAVLKEAEGC